VDDYSDLIGEMPALVRANPGIGRIWAARAGAQHTLILTWPDKLVIRPRPGRDSPGARGKNRACEPSWHRGTSMRRKAGNRRDAKHWKKRAVPSRWAIAPLPIGAARKPRRDPSLTDGRTSRATLLVWTATFRLRRGPERQRLPVTIVAAVFRAPPSPSDPMHRDTGAAADGSRDTALRLRRAATPGRVDSARCADHRRASTPDTLLAPGGTATSTHNGWRGKKPVDMSLDEPGRLHPQTIIEPFPRALVEPIRFITRTERQTLLAEAGYNPFSASRPSMC